MVSSRRAAKDKGKGAGKKAEVTKKSDKTKSTAASLKGRATKVEEEIAEEVETKASVTNTAAGAGGSESESRAAGSPPSLIAKSSDPAVEAPAEADSEATDADTTDSKQADMTAPCRKIEPPVTTANEKNSADGGNVLVEEGGGREASSPGTAVKSEANPMSVGAAGVAAVTAAVVAASQEVAVSGAGDQKGNTNAGQANAGGDEEDSSDGDDVGDGFRIVVGREREAPAAPAAPTKRFLRGTNTLVNTPPPAASNSSGNSSITTKSSAASKPVSAAAAIASLVPSKGAPVVGARPSLKPGEYPPTAELQVPAGKSAFDVDIDGMEEQPWRHPGVDVADFFNYGFTEESWRVYCEKQLRNRYDKFNRTTAKSTKNSNHMRHAGGGPRRGGGDPPRPMQPPHSGVGRGNFPPRGPPGAPPDAWGPGGRPGPPGGLGHVGGPPPWFDGSGPGPGGPPHVYPPGVGQNMPPRPGVGHARGGDMERWNGDRQGGDDFRQPEVGASQDQRPGGNSLLDALRNSGAGSGGQRSLSPTPARRGF